MSDGWDLVPGDHLSREDRVARFGGSRMGGIQPSTTSKNVFVYSDPSRGQRHGYIFDGWTADRSLFLYTGEGTRGPQRIWKGNLAIQEHKNRGTALQLFVADGRIPGRAAKNQLYVGEFEIDSANAFVTDEAEDDDGLMRSVLIFRLRPIGATLVRDQDFSITGDALPSITAQLVALEAGENTEFELPAGRAGIATRREYLLTEEYKASLGAHGEALGRWKLRPPGMLRNLFTDLYDPQQRELFEVKGTNSREDIRMAIGQLLDYRRWIIPAPLRCTVLLPGPPPPDLAELLTSLGLSLVYKHDEHGAFVRRDP